MDFLNLTTPIVARNLRDFSEENLLSPTLFQGNSAERHYNLERPTFNENKINLERDYSY